MQVQRISAELRKETSISRREELLQVRLVPRQPRALPPLAQEPSVGTQDGLPTSKPRIYSFNSQVEADRLHAAHAQNRGGERPSETDQYTRPRQVQ